MTREQLQEKSLNDLREIAKLQGVKSLTKYRKGELIDIIMNGGRVDAPAQSESAQPEAAAPAAEEKPAAPPVAIMTAFAALVVNSVLYSTV